MEELGDLGYRHSDNRLVEAFEKHYKETKGADPVLVSRHAWDRVKNVLDGNFLARHHYSPLGYRREPIRLSPVTSM